MKMRKLLIYLFTFPIILVSVIYINVNADSKVDNFSNNLQNTMTSNNIVFPNASNKTEQVGDYVKSFSTKVSNAKLDLKSAKKQFINAKTNKVKDNANKRINKVNSQLDKLNNSKASILSKAKQDIKLAENKKKNAKTYEEHINANVSLNRSEISYSELDKVLK